LNGTFEEALEDILNETLVTTNRLLDNDDFSAGSLRSLVNSLDTVTDIFEKRATGINGPEREVTIYFKLVQTSTLNKLVLEIMTCKSNAFHEERIGILLTVQYFCACSYLLYELESIFRNYFWNALFKILHFILIG
jgi:hypothetical protein